MTGRAPPASADPAAEALFTGLGEMRARCRALDWAATPLGPVTSWPAALQAAVRLCLDAGFPASVQAGPERVLVYNDGYIQALGPGKHPWALGRQARDVWPENVEQVASAYAALLAGGPPVYEKDARFVIDRNGRPEETFWTYTLFPVRADDGAVLGVFAVGTETTARMRAEAALRASEARHAFLVRLGDALRPLTEPAEIQGTASRLLGEHLGVDRAMYAENDGEAGAEHGTIRGQYVHEATPLPPRIVYRAFGKHVPERYRRGEPVVVADVLADPEYDAAERAAWTAAEIRAAVGMSLVKDGRFVASFGVLSTDPRAWTADEVALVQETAERTWEAAERARAESARDRLLEGERRARAEANAARDRTERLQRLGAELTRSLTPDAVIDAVVRHLVQALGAQAAGVYELSADGQEFRLSGSAGVDARTRERIIRVPVDTPLPLGQMVQTGAAVLIEDSSTWRAAHRYVPVMPGDDVRAWAALPLRVDGGPDARLLGALTVTLPGPRTFGDEERAFLQAFADLCAQALERARLYEAERRARERAEALQALAAALARAATPEEVANAVVTLGMAATATRFGVLSLLDEEGRTFTVAAAPGAPEAPVASWRQFPNTGELPAAVAVRTGRPCYSRTRAEYVARGPGFDVVAEQLGLEAEAVLPLAVDGRVIGVLSLEFAAPRDFDAEEDAHLRALADLCGPALERARLFEAERARVVAEAARAEAEAARAAAEAAGRAKDDLLAVVSHELRAPLAPARALAQALARADVPPSEVRAVAAEIDRHIAYEARLIADLLDYQRAARGLLALQCRRCDVHEIAREALRVAGPVLHAKGIPLTEDFATADPVVWADSMRIQQIVYNLLANAAQFSPVRAPVVVRTRNPAPEWIELAVVDAGFGVAPDLLARLFEPFVQGGSPQGARAGLGLGLALSRRLAELQGGTLTAASEGPGRGATFTLRLPTARVQQAGRAPDVAPSGAARATGAADASAVEVGASDAAAREAVDVSVETSVDATADRPLRILVLEDDVSAARALRRLLTLDGHVVHLAENLAAAERLAGAEPLDVVLADLRLGAESGLAAPRRLAEAARRQGRAAPPAVVLSGYDRDSDVAESRAAGFVAHLAKPVDEQALLLAVRRAAGNPSP